MDQRGEPSSVKGIKIFDALCASFPGALWVFLSIRILTIISKQLHIK